MRRCRRRRHDAGRQAGTLTHSQYSNLNTPSFLPLSLSGRLAGRNLCGAMDLSFPFLSTFLPSFLPGVVVVVFAIAIAIRHRWFLYIGAELMVWPLFPFLFLLSLLSLSFAYIYGRNAPTIMSTLITIKKDLLHSVSRDRTVSLHLEGSCVTNGLVLLGFLSPEVLR